jgi:hypothetical protein
MVTPGLRAVYFVASIVALVAFVAAVITFLSLFWHFLPERFDRFAVPAVALTFTSFAIMMTVWTADWLVLEFLANRRWARARARILSMDVKPFGIPSGDSYQGERIGFEALLRGVVASEQGPREMEIVSILESGVACREHIEKHLAARIVDGGCEVAIEPGEGGRAFLLPWHTSKPLCLFFLAISWPLAAFLLYKGTAD